MSNRDRDAAYNDAAEVVPKAIEEWARNNVRTAWPGFIRGYDAPTMRARVQPAIRSMFQRRGQSPECQDRASIFNVPVHWSAAGGFASHMPAQPGDHCWIMFSMRGMDEFKRTLEMADPPPMVQMAQKDAVAYCYRAEPINWVATDGAVIQHEGGNSSIVIRENQIVLNVGGATIDITDGRVVITTSAGVATFP